MAVVFFLLSVARHFKAAPQGALSQAGEPDGRSGVWPALVVGGIIWAPMVPFYFIGDDFEHLARAQGPILAGLWELTTRGQLGAFVRPVGFATIFFDHRIYGAWAPGYHLTNLIIHLIAVAGVYYTAEELHFGARIASCAALIYAVLPIECEAVAWMGARFDLLSACFFLWGTVAYLRYRWNGRSLYYILSLVCFFLAVLSKENAYVFPLMILSVEYLMLPQRQWRPIAGCFLLAICLFIYRWAILGGIGGYKTPNGQPMVLHTGIKVLQGLFLRAPSLLLLGLNWTQPSLTVVSLLFSLTAAAVLMLPLLSASTPGGWRRAAFCLAWMILPLLPAHPLLLMGTDLQSSRILYLPAIGLAIFLSNLLAGIISVPIRRASLVALLCLFGAGAVHNLEAWQWASGTEKEFLAEVKRMPPIPPPNAQFVFYGLPTEMRGIDFHVAGLQDAIRMILDRNDVGARRGIDSAGRNDEFSHGSEIQFRWKGTEHALIELQNPVSENFRRQRD